MNKIFKTPIKSIIAKILLCICGVLCLVSTSPAAYAQNITGTVTYAQVYNGGTKIIDGEIGKLGIRLLVMFGI